MHEELMEIALKRSILIPSNEIYGHISGFYDYGAVGAPLKNRIQQSWRKFFIQRDGLREISTVHIVPEVVLQASGHVGHFGDPIVKCKKCKSQHRADSLVYDKTDVNCEGKPPEEINKLIQEHGIKCPDCEGDLEPVGWFNLMFQTNIGAVAGSNPGYARPETAQGIFLDFMRVFRASGTRLPLGIAQIGKSYRNEISPRQGLVRLREFTQMEIEYFFNPNNPKHERFGEVADYNLRLVTQDSQKSGKKDEVTEISCSGAVEKGIIPNEIMAYYIARTFQFYEAVGIQRQRMRFRHMLPEETPHYSKGNFDLEVETSYGWIETVGIAYRTDYDLSNHAKMSKQDLSVFVEEEKKKLVPHVVEPSMGVDRMLWCILEHCYRDGGGAEKRDWSWFDFPPQIAPFDCAVFPLMKKDGMKEKASELADSLRDEGFNVVFDYSGSIGKRYARQDEIGTPYCMTVDYDTLKDDTVTLRYRNDGQQERVKVSELSSKLRSLARSGRVSL